MNRTFYRYGGHIELIRFKEYYRMPRGHEHISFVFSSAFRDLFLLPGISRQQTIFLSDLRSSICDCSALQSAVCSSKCLAAAPVFLLGGTRHFVLLPCEICAEIVVYRMFAVFLNGLNGKNGSRSIVRNIFSLYFFHSRFQD